MTMISPTSSILVVDDSPENLRFLMRILAERGHQVRTAISGELALDTIGREVPDLVILDVCMPGMDGVEVCRRLKAEERSRDIPVIFVSALAETEGKIRALSVGGVDYITRPFHVEELTTRVETHLNLGLLRKELELTTATLERKVEERTADLSRTNEQLRGEIEERKRAEQTLEQMGAQLRERLQEIENLKLQLEAENFVLREEISQEHRFREIIGSSDALKYVLFKIEQIAPTNTTVLIEGETGTGKELAARAIHEASGRRERPLIKVNCAALPSNLIESELFGHEKGAFTGAFSRQLGRFEVADGSTIFLDEIGELPLVLQPKLLQVLQDSEFERLGSAKTIKTNVRVIAATNRDLEEAVSKAEFRKDLWYRLNVFPITMPPLRLRREDIRLLAEWFVKKHAKNLGKRIESISVQALSWLEAYEWPGNVRELENVIQRAVINNRGDVLQLADRLDACSQKPDQAIKCLADQEREFILQALEKTNWRVSGEKGAAAFLGLNPSTLRGRMRKLSITKP